MTEPPEDPPEAEVSAEPAGAAEEDAHTPLPGAGTSDGDALREAFRAFEVGDYALVRARTRALREAEDEDVREAAADLRARTDVDPVQVVAVLACAAVLSAIVYVWIL